MNIGESMHLGSFVVRCTLRFDNPYFPRYVVFKGDKLVGMQFSVPNLSDCKWLERGAEYAASSGPTYTGVYRINYRRGATSAESIAKRLKKAA